MPVNSNQHRLQVGKVIITYLLCRESIPTLINHQLANQVALFVLHARQNLFPCFARILGESHLAPVRERTRFLEFQYQPVVYSPTAVSGQDHKTKDHKQTYRPNPQIRRPKRLKNTLYKRQLTPQIPRLKQRLLPQPENLRCYAAGCPHV